MKERKTHIESPVRESEQQFTFAESVPFTPRKRPSYPILIVIDDGEIDKGESHRIRSDAIKIGRSEGDLRFPADAMMSGLHASIAMEQLLPGSWSWILRDLNSRHGLFLRCEKANLGAGNEFLISSKRFHLNGPSIRKPSNSSEKLKNVVFIDESRVCQTWSISLTGYQSPIPELRVPLTKSSVTIGRDAEPFPFMDDLQVELKHASIELDRRKNWILKDHNSKNGTWLRVTSVVLDETTTFMLGEQRFIFKLPSV